MLSDLVVRQTLHGLNNQMWMKTNNIVNKQ